ncbi:MAG: LytR C-terminal domain-containing protein [Armatimonadetes bacterium]|nr:LytR C-terminal domain-containing protein [Armatimonadota bacterium]
MKGKVLTITGFAAAALAATIATANLVPPRVFDPLETGQDKTLTMDFRNAAAQDVFEWLKKSGVDFVVETGSIPKDKRLTVSIKGRSADEAVEAVAEALGMGVTKKGRTFVLRPEAPWGLSRSDGKAFMAPQFDKDAMKAWRLYAPDMSKDWEKWSDELKDSFKDLPKTEWNEKDWETFSKGLKDSLKDVPKWKGLPDGGSFDFKEPKDLPPMTWDFKGFDGKEWNDLKGLREFKDWKGFKDFPANAMKFGDIGKLIESLTPEQLKKNKSKGYLTVDDLTSEQRKLLGSFDGDGDFTVRFDKDGKSVTIKRK